MEKAKKLRLPRKEKKYYSKHLSKDILPFNQDLIRVIIDTRRNF